MQELIKGTLEELFGLTIQVEADYEGTTYYMRA